LPIIVFAQQVLVGIAVRLARHDRRAAAAIPVAHRNEFGHSRNLPVDELATLEHAPARMRLEVTGLAARRETDADPSGRIGAHRVRAKRGPMTGSGITRHLLESITADHDPPYEPNFKSP
jgi:hypothetical protein